MAFVRGLGFKSLSRWICFALGSSLGTGEVFFVLQVYQALSQTVCMDLALAALHNAMTFVTFIFPCSSSITARSSDRII